VRPSDREVVEDLATIEAIHRMNARLSIGTVAVIQGVVYYLITIPLAWYALDADLVRRMFDQTRIIMRELDPQL
jgi:hypothetical protein